MRFNARELAFLAQEKKSRFDKEGLLHIKEKHDGIFRKGEVYTERWCRLRGNLLFYFKTKDPSSEVAGVIVLERCVVELDQEEELDYSFVLVFEGDDKVQYLAANTERERDTWIEALHIASYECMKIQLQSLREQLRARTGRDPIENPEPTVLEENKPESQEEDTEPVVEMCVSCKDLPNIGGRQPNCYVSFSTVTPPHQQWIKQGQTEIIEKDSNPSFLTTIGFGSNEILFPSTRVRVTIYDVKERMTNTVTQIGSAVFTMEDLIGASSNRLTLTLSSAELSDAGEVTIMGWQNELACPISDEGPRNSLSPSKPSIVFGVTKRGSSKKLDMLRPLYANIIRRTYQFPTNEEGPGLNVHEYSGESRYTFYIPRELLKLWIEEEKARIGNLQELEQLTVPLESHRQSCIDDSIQLLTYYKQNQIGIDREGAYFKPSAKKGHKELEFVPTNLHLQRLWVQNEQKGQGACYDITTCGAFTAYAQKYKQGGLRRQMQHLRDQYTATYEGRTKLEKISETLNSLEQLREAVHYNCEGMCRSALQGDMDELKKSMSLLSDKTRQAILICESRLVDEGVQNYLRVKISKSDVRPQSEILHTTKKEQNDKRISELPLTSDTWRWSGTDFVKTPTEEPFDMTRLNTEAAVMCIVSKVEDVFSKQTNPAKWLEDLSPLVIRLKSCVEILIQKARAALTFLTVQEFAGNIAQMHTIKYRRDVVFSQALTAAVSAFVTKLRTSVTDEAFLKQLCQIGVLLQFESLLSCHGNELGMLDDMMVAVSDLSHVVFKVECCVGSDQMLPIIQGNRTGYIVKIPVPQHMFQLLPKELQRGHSVKVVPTLFTVGINEQATLAEKFGDTSLQEMVNIEGFRTLYHYYEKYVEIVGEQVINPIKRPFSLEELVRHLNYNVMAKKSKNVEILHFAAEICRKINGIRFTSCKSGKDRTAMSATLEQCQILQREHDLASHVFTHALECMRSEGVRRENTLKNAGHRKYAFNSLQLLALPKIYRPPQGTFGNIET